MDASTEQFAFNFEGSTYDMDRDGERLGRQMAAVKRLMIDGRWRTLAEIAKYAGGSQAAVSARLRDLRKIRFGCYSVERRHVVNGVWQYKVRA
jgi:hypothetical protein